MPDLSEEQMAINDDDRLLRRVIFTDPRYVKPDGSVSSFAFTLRRDEDGLSVDIQRLTTYEKAIQDRTKYRLYALEAGIPRNLGLECIYDPVEGNDAHALIKGKFTKPISRRLARAAEKVAYPE